MDLKEVIAKVKNAASAAHSAYYAGHHDKAEEYLHEIENLVVEHLRMPATPAGDVTESNKEQAYSMANGGASKESDVTESATSETPAEEHAEKPAEVPGAVLPATQFLSSDAEQKKALDQAGP